jgi:hypothetical protein
MDAQTLAHAATYARIKATALAYYHAHAKEIAERRKAKYQADHPNPRPRGRPRGRPARRPRWAQVAAAAPPPPAPS